jgi:hypothetical protein
MIKRDQGKTKTMYFPKAASTVFTDGNFVAFDGSGNVTNATTTTTGIVGVVRRTTSSADTDYASNTLIPVQVPIEKFCTWYADTSSATAANVGLSYDLATASTINLSGTSYKPVTVVGYISATQVLIVINSVILGL